MKAYYRDENGKICGIFKVERKRVKIGPNLYRVTDDLIVEVGRW